MNNTIAILLALLCTSAIAEDKPKITYAGEGRYTCSGNSAACAQIDANNRRISQDSADRYERKRAETIERAERAEREQRR